MPRPLSQDALSGVLAQECGLPIIELLTIYASDTVVFRACNNTENIVSRGSTFLAVGFDAVPPEEKDDGFSTLEVTVNNVDQWLTQALREAPGEISVLYEVVSQTAAGPPPVFDSVEQALIPLQVKTATMYEKTVKLTCGPRRWLEQAFPAMSFTSADFPGMF